MLLARKGGDILKNFEVNPLDMRRLIKEVDPHEAVGPDGISPVVLKVCVKTLDIPQVMSKISFSEGC